MPPHAPTRSPFAALARALFPVVLLMFGATGTAAAIGVTDAEPAVEAGAAIDRQVRVPARSRRFRRRSPAPSRGHRVARRAPTARPRAPRRVALPRALAAAPPPPRRGPPPA
ncbi:MAG: hypothetical protein AB7L84_08870 [Acidimicrobiia bacterium]